MERSFKQTITIPASPRNDPRDVLMIDDSHSRRRSGPLRAFGGAALFAVVFLIVGWSGYWYVAQHMALQEFHVQLEKEARLGRVWSCDSLASGGYPLAVVLDCVGPKLRIDEGLASQTWSARRAFIHAQLYAPKLVEIDLSGPGNLRTDSAQASLNWTTLQISARGLPQRLERLSVEGRGMTADADGISANADSLHFQLKRTASAPMAPYTLTAGLAGISSPVLARTVGPGSPALFTLLGAVTQLDAAGSGHWTERMEAWRAAGGRISIAAMSLTRDDFAVQGEGTIGLDTIHRPEGKLAVRLRNAGPLLLALAEGSGKLQRNTIAGQLTAGILGRPGELKFDAAADNGALSVGPLRRILTLPPLY